jgi:hypothetical protein
VEYWRGQGVEPTGYYFNPNIQPYQEFEKRLEGVRAFAAATELALREDLTYDPVEWFRCAGLAGEERCRRCLGLRLTAAAAEAADRGFPSLSTTLSISPWQRHDFIKEEGARAAEEHGVEFRYVDLRHIYRKSQRMAVALGLYRQKYCGCVVSEWERYRGA